MVTITVELSDDLSSLVNGSVSAGVFSSPSVATETAVRKYMKENPEQRRVAMTTLSDRGVVSEHVATALAELNAGPLGVSLDTDPPDKSADSGTNSGVNPDTDTATTGGDDEPTDQD